ncbi:MAG: cytochrome c-type biogenesis protein [Acidimicrobiales bacterium]
MRALRSPGLFALALIALVVATLVLSPTAPSRRARIAHLESLVRCPSCEDLSVAQSSAPTALAVRHEIAAAVARGASDTTILTTLETAYGPAILLSPPTSGLGTLLWAGPLALIVAALALGALRWRRRR